MGTTILIKCQHCGVALRIPKPSSHKLIRCPECDCVSEVLAHKRNIPPPPSVPAPGPSEIPLEEIIEIIETGAPVDAPEPPFYQVPLEEGVEIVEAKNTSVKCRFCDAALSVPARYFGRLITCPNCHHAVEVPAEKRKRKH